MNPTQDEDPVIEYSPLCQRVTRHGVTVEVEIYGDLEGKWILEVIDEENASHVWEDHFATDQEALAEAVRALEGEPLEFAAQAAGGTVQ